MISAVHVAEEVIPTTNDELGSRPLVLERDGVRSRRNRPLVAISEAADVYLVKSALQRKLPSRIDRHPLKERHNCMAAHHSTADTWSGAFVVGQIKSDRADCCFGLKPAVDRPTRRGVKGLAGRTNVGSIEKLTCAAILPFLCNQLLCPRSRRCQNFVGKFGVACGACGHHSADSPAQIRRFVSQHPAPRYDCTALEVGAATVPLGPARNRRRRVSRPRNCDVCLG